MGETALAFLFFALGVAVIVLFVLATLTHGVIRDLHANQKVIFDVTCRLRKDLEELRSGVEDVQEALDYGRRPWPDPRDYRVPGMVEEQP
jgi:hypothetical protein